VGIVGSATAVVKAGDPAFEVNHPGGVCWGNGTALQVTPDIVPGDVVSVRFGAQAAGDTVAGDAFVTTGSVQTGATVTVTGHIGASVPPANIEQRIVEPLLVDTNIGKRDVRALPGPLTPAPTGGYSSALEFPTATTFKATYVFDDPDGAGVLTGADNAAIVADAFLGERLLSWQAVDLAGNRQGLTIGEFGTPGGPGFGGCPNGPLQAGPPGPTNVKAAAVAGGIKLTWTPAVALPGTPPISGYRVHAVSQTVTNGEQLEFGKRIAGQAATGTTITGLSATDTYDVEVVSLSSVGQTFPAIHATPIVDVTPPVITASPNGGSFATPRNVSLTSNEAGTQIFYTTDGTSPLDAAGDVSLAAKTYTGPFTVGTSAVLSYVGFDPSGNPSTIGVATFTITNTPTPAAPTFGTVTVGNGTITANWTSADPSITLYGIQVYTSGGVTVGGLRETATQSMVTTGLTPNSAYYITVKAKNTNGYGPESAKFGPLIPTGSVVANAGPDQTIARGLNPVVVSLTGAGSTPGATYAWTQITNGGNDPDAVTITGATTLTPTFTLGLYSYPQTNLARTFRLTVTFSGGTAVDDVRVFVTPDQVSVTKATWKAGDFRVTGAGSLAGATVKVHNGALTGPVLGTAVVVAGVPSGTFDIRLRNGAAPAAKPATVWIESSAGGTAGPFAVQ
ncbi:MAG: fibronectin type III domain-containing protein, partial [Chloroflexota bacterium]